MEFKGDSKWLDVVKKEYYENKKKTLMDMENGNDEKVKETEL